MIKRLSEWEFHNILNRKRDAYTRLFIGANGELKPDAAIVLRDLQRYCRARSIIAYRTNDGTIDPLGMANANGRREVWDRIMHFLHIPEKTKVEMSATENET